MCISEQVSWIVLGSGVTVGAAAIGIPPQKNVPEILFIFSYLFSLLMQFHDGMRWRQVAGKSSFLSPKTLAHVGYMLNVLQPVVLGILTIVWLGYVVTTKKEKHNTIPRYAIPRLLIATALVVMYVVCVLGISNPNVMPSPLSCKHHIQYPWWKEGRTFNKILYVVVLLGLLAVLFADDPPFGGIVIGYTIAVLLISMFMDHKANASLWCLLFAGAPLLLIVKKIKLAIENTRSHTYSV